MNFWPICGYGMLLNMMVFCNRFSSSPCLRLCSPIFLISMPCVSMTLSPRMIGPALARRRRRVAGRRWLGSGVVRRPGIPRRRRRRLHRHRREGGMVPIRRRLLRQRRRRVGWSPLVVLGRERVVGVGRVRRWGRPGVPVRARVGGRWRLRLRRRRRRGGVAGDGEAAVVGVGVHGGGGTGGEAEESQERHGHAQRSSARGFYPARFGRPSV
jgi:hypothetical protein